VGTLGQLVDFDLLCQQWWNSTPQDPDRAGRRAAEILVLDQVRLQMISHVVTKTQVARDKARQVLDLVGGTRQYLVLPDFYYS
jgi:hypothetical protein